MKIPSKNTCAYAICKFVYKNGPSTGGDLKCELYKRFSRDCIEGKIADLISAGMLRHSDKYDLSMATRKFFEDTDPELMPRAPAPGIPAPSRVVRPFTPLAGYKLPINGAREGAADHRQFKSRHF